MYMLMRDGSEVGYMDTRGTGERLGYDQKLIAVLSQPRPMSAMELIHKQPVRWTNKKVVSCDGGGGPLGHPRIFINTDKPQICWCTYCGLPFVRQSSLPNTQYQRDPLY